MATASAISPGLTRRTRLSRRARRHVCLAAAVLSLAESRQRLRRARITTAWIPKHGTLGEFVEFMNHAEQLGMRVIVGSGGQPHLRSPSLVPGGAQGPELDRIATGMSGRRRGRETGTKEWCFRACRKRPGRGIRSPVSTTFTGSTIFSRTSTRPIRRVQREIMRIMGFWLQLGVCGFPHGRGAVPDREERRRRRAAQGLRNAAPHARFPAVAAARRDPARRGERAAGRKHAVLRRGRRPAADDAELSGQPAAFLRAGHRRHPAARARARSDVSSGRRRRNG